jgi:hypothetical protein
MHVLLKFVSLVWMHRKQHSCQESIQSAFNLTPSVHVTVAHLFIALLLPLGDQHRIGVVVLEQPVVQRLADGFFLVVQVVYVT